MPSAASRVFAIPELLVCIFDQIDRPSYPPGSVPGHLRYDHEFVIKDLFKLQRVCRSFKAVITDTAKLRRRMLLEHNLDEALAPNSLLTTQSGLDLWHPFQYCSFSEPFANYLPALDCELDAADLDPTSTIPIKDLLMQSLQSHPKTPSHADVSWRKLKIFVHPTTFTLEVALNLPTPSPSIPNSVVNESGQRRFGDILYNVRFQSHQLDTLGDLADVVDKFGQRSLNTHVEMAQLQNEMPNGFFMTAESVLSSEMAFASSP